MEEDDRAVGLTFSLKLSEIKKLNRLCRLTGMNRSELLSAWLDKEYQASNPEPETIEEAAERG